MKKSVLLIVLFSNLFIFQSCKKSITAENQNYIGQWVTNDALEQIIIYQDGSAGWVKQEGSTQRSINNGRIKFDSNFFIIKSGVTRKKFIIDQAPITVSQNNSLMFSGYKYYAKFNGQNFYRIF
jgi:hypothetical protein